jgi:hypothetical protein
METEFEDIIKEEAVVFAGVELINKLEKTFDEIVVREKMPDNEVEKQELIWSIDEDPWLHAKYDKEVRQSVDGESETLEELLHRF